MNLYFYWGDRQQTKEISEKQTNNGLSTKKCYEKKKSK